MVELRFSGGNPLHFCDSSQERQNCYLITLEDLAIELRKCPFLLNSATALRLGPLDWADRIKQETVPMRHLQAFATLKNGIDSH